MQTVIHITIESIRIATGYFNKFGGLKVAKTIFVGDCSRYFDDSKLLYMREMVEEIVNILDKQKLSKNNICICYDNPIINTEWMEYDIVAKEENKSFSDIISRFKKSEKDIRNKAKVVNGLICKNHNWGEFVTSELSGYLRSKTTVEYDFITAFIGEFAEHGISISSIEPISTTLLYLRHSMPYSYDNMSQILIYAKGDEKCELYTFIKNKPVKIVERTLADTDTAIIDMLNREIKTDNLRRPVIILGGDYFVDVEKYKKTAHTLNEAGFLIYDIYNCFEIMVKDSIKIQIDIIDDEQEDRCGLFTGCIAMFFRKLEQNPENLIIAKTRGISTLTAKTLSHMAIGFGGFAIVASTLFFGWQSYTGIMSYIEFKNNEKSVSELQTVEEIVQKQSDMLLAISYIDTRYEEIIKFIAKNKTSNINIISVDTEDMFPAPEASESLFQEAEAEVVPEDEQQLELEKTTGKELVNGGEITIRGFALQSSAVMTFYNNLVDGGIGTVKLSGIEYTELPDGGIAYAFEMVIGGI